MGINGVTEMKNNRMQMKWIVIAAIIIWLASLAVFAAGAVHTGITSAVYMCMYGIWNLILFSMAYLVVSRKITNIMRQVDDSIQSMIDGVPVRSFPEGEESLLGKFQVQLTKLYQILSQSRENEEKLRKEMSSLVSDMVHQINTPLTNVQMYTSFLIQDGISEQEKARMCEIVSSQIEKLGWFADGFTKTARLDEDMRKLRPEHQPILPMILSAIDEISAKAEAHGDEICLEGEQDIEAVYDRRWTEEAVFNLLDNAVKYGEENSKIYVRMTSYEIYVKVDVINYGKPVPKEDYTVIFNRYYRGNNAAFIKEGVGLGLYLTREIAAGQGGYVKVGNYRGEGTIFSLFLLKFCGSPGHLAI